ncbi:putative RecB family nuclease [Microbacterium testaceum]|nr:putative RecB family nuclease [Microbacterium testaceum]
MRYIEQDGRIVWSASDLKAAAECEFAWLRAIDAKIGRTAPVDDPEDATLERAARLGTAHELRMLDDDRARFGSAVREIPAARSSDAEALAEAVRLTDEALADPSVEVVYQAAFATEEFVGFADFLVREPEASSDGTRRWIVQDTKLARRARVTALMQLAAYVDQLDRLGVPRSDEVQLLLGDGSTSTHRVDDLLPVFGLRRERLRALIADRRVDLGTRRTRDRLGRPARRSRGHRVRPMRHVRARGRRPPRPSARRGHAARPARPVAGGRHRDDRSVGGRARAARGHER